jgi:Uma2 family endonuclease
LGKTGVLPVAIRGFGKEMSAVSRTLYTPEEYLGMERAASFRSEYLRGYIYTMAGTSIAHNTIVANFVRLLGNMFVGRPCRVFSSDMRVQVEAGSFYTYPDVVAVCGEPVLTDAKMDTLTNPTVLVEVLSPSTEAYDRGKKFEYYRKLQSLREYVLVAQNRPFVEHYVRRDNKWELSDLSSLNGTLQLESIGCELALSDVYDKVEFSQDSEGETIERQ